MPPAYLGREVWVRWNGRCVRVFYGRMEQIAIHAKHDQGRSPSDAAHVAATKINGVERGIGYLLGKVRSIGPHAFAWSAIPGGSKAIAWRMGLLALTSKHTWAELERACDTAAANPTVACARCGS